ncbi:hypothetical protein [Fusobacterium sp. THCT1E2]
MFIRFEIFCKPAYEIAFSPIDDIEENIEIPLMYSEKDIVTIVIDEIRKKNIIKKYIVLDGIAAIKDYEVDSEEETQEKPVIDKKLAMGLNQFSIFKGIIDFI